jgi:hypothetical protein
LDGTAREVAAPKVLPATTKMLNFSFEVWKLAGNTLLDTVVAADVAANLRLHLKPGSPLRRVYNSLLWEAAAYDKPASLEEASALNAEANAWLNDLLERNTVNLMVQFVFQPPAFDHWGVAQVRPGPVMAIQMHGSFVDVLSACPLSLT